jgi:hypothetical protein
MYAFIMKSRLIIKFLLLAASGVLIGHLINLDIEKWHTLGRDLFLTHQGQRFDRDMANPGTGVGLLVFCAVFSLGLGALYEGAAYAGDRLIMHLNRDKDPCTRGS